MEGPRDRCRIQISVVRLDLNVFGYGQRDNLARALACAH